MSRQMSFGFFRTAVSAVVIPLALLAAGCKGTGLGQLGEAPPPDKPTITSLSPSTVAAGGQGFTLIVNGVNFTNLSQVNWNGAPRNTTFVSAAELTVNVSALDIEFAG